MLNSIPQNIPKEKIQEYSWYFVEAFVGKTDTDRFYQIDLSFYPIRTAFETNTARITAGLVYSEQLKNHFTIHICENRLKDIPCRSSHLVLTFFLIHQRSSR